MIHQAPGPHHRTHSVSRSDQIFKPHLSEISRGARYVSGQTLRLLWQPLNSTPLMCVCVCWGADFSAAFEFNSSDDPKEPCCRAQGLKYAVLPHNKGSSTNHQDGGKGERKGDGVSS